MNRTNKTSIWIDKDVKSKLDSFKVVPSQTYEEVIESLMAGKRQELLQARKSLLIENVGQRFLTPKTAVT